MIAEKYCPDCYYDFYFGTISYFIMKPISIDGHEFCNYLATRLKVNDDKTETLACCTYIVIAESWDTGF